MYLEALLYQQWVGFVWYKNLILHIRSGDITERNKHLCLYKTYNMNVITACTY
jgi:hypothetical protein